MNQTPSKDSETGTTPNGNNANGKLLGAAIAVSLVACSAVGASWATETTATAPSKEVVDGLGIFAGALLLAQAVERLVEPFAYGFGSAKKKREAEKTVAANNTEKAKKELADVTWHRTVLLWSIATIIGTWLAAAIGFSFPSLIGLDTSTVTVFGQDNLGEFLDVLITGLIIGSGTKPLHELIARVEKKNQADSAATA